MENIPVNVWLPGQTQAVVAGLFSLGEKVSHFQYTEAYLAQSCPAISPELPVRRQPHKITGQSPVFPILLDSGPDDWGRMLLERRLERPVSELEALLLGPADGAGAIVLGELTPERFEPVTLDAFQRVLTELPMADDAASQRQRERVLQSVIQGTSLGGAKPKLTLTHEGEQYIAKFPERGDDPYLPHLELAMLRLAGECGIDACDAIVIEPSPQRYALLVRRFDRAPVSGGTARKGYVSAWSVSRLDQVKEQPAHLAMLASRGYTPAMHARSYVSFAENMKRWCRTPENYRDNVRELWRRIVFNALIRNTDDHPRNHGLLCQIMASQTWALSPAFDLVAQRASAALPKPGLSMPYLYHKARNKQTRLVSAAGREDLLLAAVLHFGYEMDEARQYLDNASHTVRGRWRSVLLQAGMPADELPRYAEILGKDLPD